MRKPALLLCKNKATDQPVSIRQKQNCSAKDIGYSFEISNIDLFSHGLTYIHSLNPGQENIVT